MTRMRWKVLLVVMLLVPFHAVAGEVMVLDAVLATGVESRAPVGTASTFSPEVGKVYAFTRVVGAGADGTVTHVWYHAGQVKAEVKLSVRSDDWRTWSSKTILASWTGEWLVEVQRADGKVLASLPFKVE